MAKEAGARGHETFALAFSGFTDPSMENYAHKTVWVKLGQLDKAVSYLKAHGVTRVIMAGKIEKINLLKPWNLWPDRRALRMLRRLEDWRDDTLLEALSNELAGDGIIVDEMTEWASALMAPPGVLTRASPTDEQWEDIEFGREMARGIGALDIGQTVVVKKRAVIVVEAIEGTDKAIRRAGDLGVSDAVVVKMAKPNQDMRFDVPGAGSATIESMIAAKARVLAVESGKTMCPDFDSMIDKADRSKIAVVGITAQGPVRS
jgi:DUF1009 family protein